MRSSNPESAARHGKGLSFARIQTHPVLAIGCEKPSLYPNMKVLLSFKPPQQHSCSSTARPSWVLHRSGVAVCRSRSHANKSSSDPSTSQHSANSRRDALLAIGTALSSLVLTGRAHSNEEDLRAQSGGDVGGAGNVTSTSSSFPEVQSHSMLALHAIQCWRLACLL